MMRYALAVAGTMLLVVSSSPWSEELPPLRTGIDGTFAPHAFPSLSGGYEGFNIDLGNDIAKRLHRGIIIDAAQFSGLIPALQAGTYDFLIAPTTVTRERADNMLFTEGYLNTDFQFLIKKGSPKVTKLEDLKGKTISVNKGSVYDFTGRATSRARSAGRSNCSARRLTPCRPFSPGARTPTLPAIPLSHGRRRTIRRSKCSYLYSDRTCLGRSAAQGFH